MERIRVGLVGCGEAVQILHAPSLALLPELFEVTALCDVSPSVVETLAARWRVRGQTTDYAELVARGDVDAVLVAAPDAYHADVTVAALAAGKHVLVEKPMCLTAREADEIEEARRAAGRVVQVGYVRLYSPAVTRAAELVHEMRDRVGLARVHDVLGLNSLIVEQTARVVRGDDVPPAASEAARRKRDALVAEAIGEVPREVADGFLLLHSLGSHGVSLARELLGAPRSVLYAAARRDAWYVTAALDYGDFVCHLELGFDRIPRVESFVEVYGDERSVRVSFDSPFVRSLPVRLTVTEATGAGGVEATLAHPEWTDPFVAEWREFHRAVTTGADPRTPPSAARQEVELFSELGRRMTCEPAR